LKLGLLIQSFGILLSENKGCGSRFYDSWTLEFILQSSWR